MAGMTIRFDASDVTRGLANLQRKAPAAIARALNRGAISARTQLVRDTAADMKLKQADVKDATTIHNATADRQAATITASAKPVPAIKFGARGPEPSRGRGRGVTAKLPAGRYPRAFIATMRSGHRGVFERRGTARLPIREIKGPSVAYVAAKHTAAAIAKGTESFTKNLEHELKRLGK